MHYFVRNLRLFTLHSCRYHLFFYLFLSFGCYRRSQSSQNNKITQVLDKSFDMSLTADIAACTLSQVLQCTRYMMANLTLSLVVQVFSGSHTDHIRVLHSAELIAGQHTLHCNRPHTRLCVSCSMLDILAMEFPQR